MPGELIAAVRAMMADYEKMDFDAVERSLAHDIQGIDELSRSWMRSRKELAAYFRTVASSVTGIHDSRFNDVHETIVGDIGILTCWLEQDYTMEGAKQHVSAPTTVVLRREDGAWKITLFHSLPLPAAG
jgi:ketosteroid isomerase-like protein